MAGWREATRIITYPGTTNHDDIREGSEYATYNNKIVSSKNKQ